MPSSSYTHAAPTIPQAPVQVPRRNNHQTLARGLKIKSGVKAGRQIGHVKFED